MLKDIVCFTTFCHIIHPDNFNPYSCFKVSSYPTCISMPNLYLFSFEGWQYCGHNICLNQMHPGRSFCLNLSANCSIGWQINEDPCLAVCKTRLPWHTVPYGPTYIEHMVPYHSSPLSLVLIPDCIRIRTRQGIYGQI